eukprot:1950011-Prorocentrum_lima.AAC.1
MTSSLVGSEMCIRDRPKPHMLGKVLHAPDTSILASAVWGLPDHLPNAVSYTHLTLPTICSV